MQGEIQRVEFWMVPTNLTWISGGADPNQPVTITTSSGDTLYGWSDGDGNFGTDHPTYLYPNDLITATAGAGNYPVTIVIPEAWVDGDSANNVVSGHISYPEWYLEIHPWGWSEMVTTTTGVDGTFTKTFGDIPPQGRGNIRFMKEFGATNVDAFFYRPFYDLQPALTVNYAHEWVEIPYNPGYQAWITVTNNVGEIKATAHGETSEIPWWNGDSGISTNYNVFWDGVQPDMEAGDYVYLRLENGRMTDVRLGEINGEFNLEGDIFTGTLNIPWLTDPVYADCGLWVNNGPWIGFPDVNPQGGQIICDFGALGWDLLPGMDIGVGYNDPEADKSLNVFNEPAPHLYINLETFGQPAYGNNYSLRLHFNNDGWATAPGVAITQTLWGMTYLSDTSGYPHTGTGTPGDPIVWDVGDMPTNHFIDTWFDVYVQIDDPSRVSSVMDVASLDYYQGMAPSTSSGVPLSCRIPAI
jgi:hypothetical protein